MAKTISVDIARRHPRLATAVYRKDARPQDRVHVDFNQNAWGRTLASVYSVRPRPRATVSTPVTWLGKMSSRRRQLVQVWANMADLLRDVSSMVGRSRPKG